MGPRPAEPKFRRRASGESYICPDEVGAYIGLGASELVKRRFGGRAGPSCFFCPDAGGDYAFVSVLFLNLHYSYGKLRNWSDDFLSTCTNPSTTVLRNIERF